jgi:hypothetical protein
VRLARRLHARTPTGWPDPAREHGRGNGEIDYSSDRKAAADHSSDRANRARYSRGQPQPAAPPGRLTGGAVGPRIAEGRDSDRGEVRCSKGDGLHRFYFLSGGPDPDLPIGTAGGTLVAVFRSDDDGARRRWC